MENKFSDVNPLKMLCKAIFVGVLSGAVVGSFRLLIEKSQGFWRQTFILSHKDPKYLLLIVIAFLIIGAIAGYLVKQQPHAGGSGIPEVELQLQGKLHLNWWSILWRKFIGGILAIGTGLFLGREGPSIQLGSSIGQGVANKLKTSRGDARVLLATGAASGLAAAFDAPLGGTMFVLEEVYHNFSPRVWINSLAGALAANFVTSNIFGQKPVLAIKYNVAFPLPLYWHLLVLGIILGILGWVYQKGLLNLTKVYKKIKIIPRWLQGIIPLILLIPIAYFAPNSIGGGNNLILALKNRNIIWILAGLFVLRLIFSLVSYDSGLPGGIFLPILALGALIGAVYGLVMAKLGLLPGKLVVNLIIFSMAGYFSGIVRSPFTAILLITEMVGSLMHLMPLAVLGLVAYIVNDYMGGEPIYESLADRMEPEEAKNYANREDQLSIPIYEGSYLDNKIVSQIKWPDHTLLQLIHRGGHDIIPNGQTIIRAGDLLILEIDQNRRAAVFDKMEKMQKQDNEN